MEDSRIRKRKSLADASRPSWLLRYTTLDDYGVGGPPLSPQRYPASDDVPDGSGIEARAEHRVLQGRERKLLESDGTRCTLILGEKKRYACYFCPGGLNYTKCLRIRGL